MGEHNKPIEEPSKEFEDLQISKMVKQVNMQSGMSIGSIGNNNPYYEQGESSNPFHSKEPHKHKAKGQRYFYNIKRKSMINEEFKPKNPLRTSIIFWVFSKYRLCN